MNTTKNTKTRFDCFQTSTRKKFMYSGCRLNEKDAKKRAIHRFVQVKSEENVQFSIFQRPKMIMRSTPYFFVSFLLLLAGCSSAPEEQDFDFALFEKCMITNLEQNNLIEGTQLRADSVDPESSTIQLELPKKFGINSQNCSGWVIGWGMNKPYFDAGVENIREIKSIDLNDGKIVLGTCKRGEGFPRSGQRVVFWNTQPSGYKKVSAAPVLHPDFWPEFNGQSMGFSSIVFDKYRQAWITLAYEVDTDKSQIYAAYSTDLVHWKPAKKGKPILTAADFDKCSWTANSAPRVSEIIAHDGKYYVFMDGADEAGKRHISVATAVDLLGEYHISKEPILSPQSTGSWNDHDVFCAKIAKRKNDFILFFDGRNEDGYERVGRATSMNLTSWKMDEDPVLDEHIGWRGATFTTEPAYVECQGDTIILMAAGAKAFQESYWHHYITHRSYMDRSGNVNDAQLGVFMSTDGGKSFTSHQNNPVFVNTYGDLFENEHMGGNFEMIEVDSTSYIFYQAKTSSSGMKYSIFVRSKSK